MLVLVSRREGDYIYLMRLVAAPVLGLLLAGALQANADSPTAAFLKIPVGAREVGMGQAFTAVADDANAAFWNPAGLGTLVSRELTASDAQMFAGTRLDTLAFAQPALQGSIGVSVGYLQDGTLDGRGADRSQTGSFTASDMVVGLSYGRPVGMMQLGATIKYIRSAISNVSATGMAADLGLLMPTRLPGLTLGAAVQNIGPGMTFLSEKDPLPLTVSGGAAYQTPMGLTISVQAQRQMHEGNTIVGAGMEMPLLSAVTARAGYQRASNAGLGAAAGAASGLGGLAGGFGFKVYGYSVDYAFTPMGELGSAQRISISSRF